MLVKRWAIMVFLLAGMPLLVFSQQTNETETVQTNEVSEVETVEKKADVAYSPSRFSLGIGYGAGSMINLAFQYRFNPFLRAGLGVGYTSPGTGNSGINILVTGTVDIYSLNLSFMTVDLSLTENLLFFSDSSAVFFGAGPSVYLTLHSFPLLTLGIINEFYFRDSGPVYQLGFDLSFNFGGKVK